MSVGHYIAYDCGCSEVRLPAHLIFTVAESSDMVGLLFLSQLVDESTWHSLYKIRSDTHTYIYHSRRFVDATVLDPFCLFPVQTEPYRL